MFCPFPDVSDTTLGLAVCLDVTSSNTGLWIGNPRFLVVDLQVVKDKILVSHNFYCLTFGFEYKEAKSETKEVSKADIVCINQLRDLQKDTKWYGSLEDKSFWDC